jgi:hypothetical protein
LQEKQNVKKRHFGGAIITYLGFLFWEIYSMVHESDRDEKWEKQNKQDLEKQTEQHKKQIQELKTELTGTKTELLLTQNKLRELKEETDNK